MNEIDVVITKNFTTIPNEIIRNKDMSLNAKMLLVTMLSLPPNWDYSINGLAAIIKEGRDTVRTALKELKQHGYLKIDRIRNANGTLGKSHYTVYQFPIEKSEKIKEISRFQPNAEKPTLAEPTLAEPTQLNKELNNKRLNNSLSNDKEFNSISNDIAFNSFSNEKGTNSTLPSNAAYVPFEERRKKRKYQHDRYSNAEKEQAEDTLPERVERIAYDYTGDKCLSITAKDCISYFVLERRKKINKPMKVFTEVTLYNLVLEMFREQEVINKDESMITVYSPLIHEGMEQEYKDVVDGYFKIDFTQECDYSLAHFLTDGVQARIKMKLPGMEWHTNCGM